VFRHLASVLLAAGLVVAGCRVMPASPAVSGSLAPSPAVDAVAAFFVRFDSEPPPPYRVTLEVTISGGSSGSARIEGEVAGADYQADVHVELAGLPPRDSRIVHVDGTAYLGEPDGSSWVTVPDYRATPPMNPFLLLDPADFTDAGTDAQRGGLRRLSSTAWVEEDATFGYREGGVRDVQFDVWLDANGVPVAAQLDYQLLGVDPAGQQVDLHYEARYQFSDVGADITIGPPLP
jgi:hypothetical protein